MNGQNQLHLPQLSKKSTKHYDLTSLFSRFKDNIMYLISLSMKFFEHYKNLFERLHRLFDFLQVLQSPLASLDNSFDMLYLDPVQRHASLEVTRLIVTIIFTFLGQIAVELAFE